MRRRALASVPMAMMAFAMLPGAAQAQDDAWPQRPISIICPCPAGISTDVLTRALANSLTASLGQAVTVDNRPGGGANIGATLAARAAPNGYTLFLGTVGPMVNNKYLYKNLSFDADTAFVPVALIASSPILIVGSPKLPVSNLAEFLAYAKKHPGQVSAGTVGTGLSAHIALETLNKLGGTSISHVPYRDLGQALPSLISGQLQAAVTYIPTFVTNVQSGMLKGLAVGGKERSKDLPNVPTLKELGYTGFEYGNWNGLFAPAGTPRSVVDRINKAVNTFLQSEDGKREIASLGMTAMGGSPNEVKPFMEREAAHWVPIIKEANISLD
jgi:tripartite-type tricarboxylate transporter receptor subunit TctC